jgi:hypothetical protein
MRSKLGRALCGIALAAVLAVGTAGAAPASSNLVLSILVGNTRADTHIVPTQQTETVKSLHFKAGLNIENSGPDPAQTVRVRLQLSDGLHWGTDLPDATENCTSTPTTANCAAPFALDSNDLSRRAIGWGWDVIAVAPADYALTAEVVESSSSDPDPSDNSSSATAHVTQTVAVGSVKLRPARPKAGSSVTAQVAVTEGGDAITPSGVVCAGKIGARRVPSVAGFSSGRATCRFGPLRSIRGKILRGSVTVVAAAVQVRKTFLVKLL